MIPTHRVGVNIDGIDVGEKFKSRDNPLLAVLVVIAALMVFTAEKGAANAA